MKSTDSCTWRMIKRTRLVTTGVITTAMQHHNAAAPLLACQLVDDL